MLRSIGASTLIVALAMTALGMVLSVYGSRARRSDIVSGGYAAVYAVFALVWIATLAMIIGLVTHDFSIEYVAQVGSRSTPLLYTIASLWGALEGSILFWGAVLSAYGALVVYLHRKRPGTLVPYTSAVVLFVNAFFLMLLVGPASPFGLVSPVPLDGPGPNPLLQNHPLMAVHPPLLYLGFVGMTVPFAFATGAMLAGELDNPDWIRLSRRWTISAWAFLSAAVVAGMWWSYEVLGWGGYWAWDPVENASFMPWLTATAFLHSVMVQERRGMLKVWNLTLIVSTFLLTLLGTFLTRSGVLSSVHAFTQGTIGYWFLGFIAVVLIASLALVAGQSGSLRSTGRLDSAISRETVFLLNNLLLSAFCFTVVLGTLFPLVAEAVRGVKVSVGAPFFDSMTLPIAMALLFLVGVGPALPWRRTSSEVLSTTFRVPLVMLLVGAIVAVVAGTRNVYTIMAFGFAGFALTVNLREFWIGARARMRAHGEMFPLALQRLIVANRHRYGGYIAHIGILAIALGIASSSTFRGEAEATLSPGQTMQLRGWTLRLDSLWGRREPQRFVVGADVSVLKGSQFVQLLSPRQNFYDASEQPVPTPSVRSRPSGDLYINLMAFERNGSTATLRALAEPLVGWIWTGGGIVFLGALIAAWPSRKRAVESAFEPDYSPARTEYTSAPESVLATEPPAGVTS